MASSAVASPESSRSRQKFGLAHWMAAVLEQCDRASTSFAKDPVHDLRVALRRCRSMADGLLAVDSCKDWKRMKKAGKQLFSALGDLRDAQVMADWIDSLGAAHDPVAKVLAADATARENVARQNAEVELSRFDRKRWKSWSDTLPKRAERIPVGGSVFLHMALERWTDARELQRRVLRHPSNLAWHRLRIGIKKFRYTVENFLPQLHDEWAQDLKQLQDYLGEVHDLDVLWETALKVGAFPGPEAHQQWQLRVQEERDRRIQKYREKMVGPNSLWKVWRKQLPHGEGIREAAYARLKLWADFLDPDPRHTRRVCRCALQLYDGLLEIGLIPHEREYDLRAVLRLAATLHDVGRWKGEIKHHKRSFRLIRQINPPLGYNAKDVQLAAIVARYHRGALPGTSQPYFARLTAAQQRRTMLLTGILRLADCLESACQGSTARLKVGLQDSHISVSVSNYDPVGSAAAQVAVARHILESLYGMALLIRPKIAPPLPRDGRARQSRRAIRASRRSADPARGRTSHAAGVSRRERPTLQSQR